IWHCHPERSEGSLSGQRSFAPLRMTILNRLRLTCNASYLKCIVPRGRPWPTSRAYIVGAIPCGRPIRINLRTDEYPWCIFCRRKTMKKKPYPFVDEILHKVNLSPNEFRKGPCLILSMLLFSVFLSFSKPNRS